MKICVGTNSTNYLNDYIKAGAEEFYCGVVDSKWISKYGYSIALNRRPWPSSNFKDFKELKECVKKAHEHNCKIFYTLNEHCYSNDQLGILDYHVQNALACQVDAIIFADIGLIDYFYKKYKCNIHLSTGGTVFNEWTANFFKNEMNVSRIIFPREVTLNEMASICESTNNIEYEAFVLNEGCLNIDGFCNHSHGINYISEKGELLNCKYSVGCMMQYEIVSARINGANPDCLSNYSAELYKAASFAGDCGACAILQLKRMGIHSLKLVGRATNNEKIISDIKFIKHAIELCEKNFDDSEYINTISNIKCKLLQGKRLNVCYYPDILRLLKNE